MMRHVCSTNVVGSAAEVFDLFSKKEGSQYIATPFNLQALLDLNAATPFGRVLEMGSGIGTMTYLLLAHSNAHVDTYEDNEFCKAALATNLAGYEARYTLLTEYATAPPSQTYDLVIVDGGTGKKHDGGAMSAVQNIARSVESRIFFIEGQRYQQRTLLRRELARRYVYMLTNYEGGTYKGVWYKGGLAIHCRPSSSALLRTLNFYYWELVEWTPVKHALMYRFRKLKARFGL